MQKFHGLKGIQWWYRFWDLILIHDIKGPWFQHDLAVNKSTSITWLRVFARFLLCKCLLFPTFPFWSLSKEVTMYTHTFQEWEVKTHLLESGVFYKLVAILPYRCYIPFLFIYSLFISLDDNLKLHFFPDCSGFGLWNSLLAPMWLWHSSWECVLSICFLSEKEDAPGSSSIFHALALEAAISGKRSDSFYWSMLLETRGLSAHWGVSCF